MKKNKALLFFFPILFVLAALYPALTRHALSFFVLKGAGSQVEAFKITAPLNGRDVLVDAIVLSPAQKKEGGEVLAQRDSQGLMALAKECGAYPAVIGIPVTQEGWPGFLGGGFKGFLADNVSNVFDNLQWTDRLYLSVSMKVPPPAPFSSAGGNEITLPSVTPGVSITPPSSTPNPAPTPGVVRVEILNGCGITNAADWVARRVKGPGIIITDTGNADNFHYPKTIVRSCAGTPVALEEAIERLGLSKDAVQEIPSLSSSVDVVVIVGKDYRKLREQFRERNRH